MSRPSAKLCAECFPTALRAPRGLRPTSLPGATRRSYATERRAFNTLRRPNRSSLVCVSSKRIPQLAVRSPQRGLATVSEGEKSNPAPQDGPMREYDLRVQSGRLRDDEYQRGRVVDFPVHRARLTCGSSNRYHPGTTGPLRSAERLQPAQSYPSRT